MRLLLIVLAVVVAATAVAACSATHALNALVPSDSHEFTTAAYGAGERRQLDIYTPRAVQHRVRPDKGWPLVVFFYGGSWNRGEKSEYRFVGEARADRCFDLTAPKLPVGAAARAPPVGQPQERRGRAGADAASMLSCRTQATHSSESDSLEPALSWWASYSGVSQPI
jgi:hypothetical protein